MTLSLAILGAGRIGRVHARAAAATEGVRIAAVADALPEAAQALAIQTGAEVRTMEAIAAAGDIEAVLICTPTDTHADLIETHARAGRAIFCEKPVDLSLARVRDCLRVVEAAGVPLMIGFNRRFDPHFAAVKRGIDEGRIGTPEMVTITSRDPGLPHLDYLPRSGGIFRDMTIHDFDMARWLLGEEVESVQAEASVLVDPRVGELGDFDSVTAILRTGSGRQAVITNSRRAAYGYDQRIEVLGEKGMISARNQRAEDIEVATADGFCRPPLMDFFMSRYTAAYAAEIAAFLAAVQGGHKPTPSGRDGLMALALAEAAIVSVREGRRVKIEA